MFKHENKKIQEFLVNELCDYLGYELDGNMCQELRDFIETCPECKEYIDSIEMTVNICKKMHQETPCPNEVKENLLLKLRKVCKPK